MKNLKKNAGFTLVELIVVIAILGILAGVGTVAYTGYVDKAKEAADQQLLSAVNLAFASACIDSGTDMNELTAAEVSTVGEDGHKKVTGASSTQISDDDFSANFMKYFAGNENSEFQTGTPKFNETTHLFYLDKPNGTTTMDTSLTAEQKEQVRQFKTSNLGKDATTLATMAGNLSQAAGKILDGTTVAYLKTQGYMSDEEYNSFIQKYPDAETNTTVAANALVLHIAGKLASANWEDDDPLAGDILSQKAMDLALMQAYVKSNYVTDEFKKEYEENFKPAGISDIVAWTQKMKDDGKSGTGESGKGYGNYESSDDINNDTLACINAMEIILAKQNQFDLSDANTYGGQATIDFMQALLDSVGD